MFDRPSETHPRTGSKLELTTYLLKECGLTMRFNVFPSGAFFVNADFGVSGSIKPVRMFLSNSTFPTSIQSGFVLHGSSGGP